ncbi:potassium channel family protein [Prescottella subtropica]|uniref:potassium channel family protein n=1 Tax=Prescottella subtropica TaxID=2545757 RepID=UPI001F503770|nr:potassium channel family protein [Prescottella subtropica]
MPDSRDGRTPTRALLGVLLRPLVTVSGLMIAYFVLPMTDLSDAGTVAVLVGGVLGIAALFGWQVWCILRSPVPTLRSAEALVVTLPTYLLGSATAVHLMSSTDPAAFTQPLTRIDALYFTLTVFATVGFGDIAAVDQTARILVTAMIVGNLVMLSVGIRLLTAAGKRGRARHHGDGPA